MRLTEYKRWLINWTAAKYKRTRQLHSQFKTYPSLKLLHKYNAIKLIHNIQYPCHMKQNSFCYDTQLTMRNFWKKKVYGKQGNNRKRPETTNANLKIGKWNPENAECKMLSMLLGSHHDKWCFDKLSYKTSYNCTLISSHYTIFMTPLVIPINKTIQTCHSNWLYWDSWVTLKIFLKIIFRIVFF